MSDFEAVRRLLLLHSGIEDGDLDRESNERLARASLAIYAAGVHQDSKKDQRPDVLEQELEAVRSKLLDVIREIEKLDTWALSVARRSQVRREIDAAGPDPKAIIAAMDRAQSVPTEEWPDKVAIRGLKALEEGLRDPIETLIRKGRGLSEGRGTKPNLVARNLALAAARALADMTGESLSYWRDGTAFAKLTADLFRAFDIKADTRRACEWALSELEKSA